MVKSKRKIAHELAWRLAIAIAWAFLFVALLHQSGAFGALQKGKDNERHEP